jgi:hypothetical protein
MLASAERLGSFLACSRLARVEAEALVWNHGDRGAAFALGRLHDTEAGHPEWAYRRMVARIAVRCLRLLESADTPTRHESWEHWSSRPAR